MVARSTEHAALRIPMHQRPSLRSDSKGLRQTTQKMRQVPRRCQTDGVANHLAAQSWRACLRPRDRRRCPAWPSVLVEILQKRQVLALEPAAAFSISVFLNSIFNYPLSILHPWLNSVCASGPTSVSFSAVMLAKVNSAALYGIDALRVEVEIDLASGLPQLATVGLPEGAVKESKDRIRAAVKNC